MKEIIILILLIAPASVWAKEATKPNVYKTVADELLKNCEGADKKIAVAGFSYSDGRDSRDGGVVAERITTELVKAKKFKIIERKEIEKVFEELKLQRSGAIDSDSAKEIGKMLGADWVVVGTLTELPDRQLELNARIAGVESGEIINASNTPIKKDWLDQYKKILEDQNSTINTNSKSAQAFYERGVINTDLEEYDNAIAAFGIALAINPIYMEAYRGRGRVYQSKGENDKAIEDCSKAIEIDPKNADAYNYRGNVYTAKREYDKAIEDYSKTIAIDPRHAKAYSNRGNAYYAKGDYNEAIKDYSKAITIDAKLAVAYSNRGNAYRAMGEYEKAATDNEKYLNLSKKSLQK